LILRFQDFLTGVERLCGRRFLFVGGSNNAGKIGRRGERIAARWLRRRGHRILARNLRHGRLELDLLVESPDGQQVIVVEVKTGRGSAEQLMARVRPPQLRRLELLAGRIHGGRLVGGRSMRTDIILVLLDQPWARRVVHLRGSES
jgi:putative endonuclease